MIPETIPASPSVASNVKEPVSYKNKVLKVALAIFIGCYRILFFHIWYKLKLPKSFHVNIACMSTLLISNCIFQKIFPDKRDEELNEIKMQKNIEKILIYLQKNPINFVIGSAVIILKTYVEAAYASLERNKLLINFFLSSLAIIASSAFLRFFLGYSLKVILSVMNYYIFGGVFAIVILLIVNHFIDKSLKNYDINHGLCFLQHFLPKNCYFFN